MISCIWNATGFAKIPEPVLMDVGSSRLSESYSHSLSCVFDFAEKKLIRSELDLADPGRRRSRRTHHSPLAIR